MLDLEWEQTVVMRCGVTGAMVVRDGAHSTRSMRCDATYVEISCTVSWRNFPFRELCVLIPRAVLTGGEEHYQTQQVKP